MLDPEPETVDALLATLGDCVERLLKTARLARECDFTAVEATIRGDLERAQRELLLALCVVPDGAPRRHVMAMLSKVATALGITPSRPPGLGAACAASQPREE
jgi:hypothetical protein